MGSQYRDNTCACGKPCYGEQCRDCYTSSRKENAEVRTCNQGCGKQITSRNRSGACLKCIRSKGLFKEGSDLIPNEWPEVRKAIFTNSMPKRRWIAGVIVDSIKRLIACPEFPRAPAVKVKRHLAIDTLAVYSPTDAHFGMLTWKPETGHDYDVKIATDRYLGAAADAARVAKRNGVGGWVHPIGNDFMHFDTANYTTTAGTTLDVDGRHARVYEYAVKAAIAAVSELREVGPVRVVHVPGNHDVLASRFICMIVREHFRDDEGVTVDLSPSTRKYSTFGSTLFGFTHGHKMKPADLARVMSDESPEWSTCPNREWFTGHKHYKETTQVGSCTIRQIPSMTPPDAWHHESGYVGTKLNSELHIFDHSSGHVCQWTIGDSDARQ